MSRKQVLLLPLLLLLAVLVVAMSAAVQSSRRCNNNNNKTKSYKILKKQQLKLATEIYASKKKNKNTKVQHIRVSRNTHLAKF